MTEINVKVTLHRARQAMRAYDKNRVVRFTHTNEEMRRTLEQFLLRLAAQDVQGLEQMLAEDVVVVSDGGGEINALSAPMSGRPKVMRLISQLYGAYREVTRTSLQVLNGQPAVLIHRSQVKPGHASFFTMHCELDEMSHMRRLHFVFAPSKLSALKQSGRTEEFAETGDSL